MRPGGNPLSEKSKFARRHDSLMKRRFLPAGVATALALAVLGACTPRAEDLVYPDLLSPQRSVQPAALLTPAERDAAISELNAEAAANAELSN